MGDGISIHCSCFKFCGSTVTGTRPDEEVSLNPDIILSALMFMDAS